MGTEIGLCRLFSTSLLRGHDTLLTCFPRLLYFCSFVSNSDKMEAWFIRNYVRTA
jgi:hypothetical protein